MKTLIPQDELSQIIALEHLYSVEDTRSRVYPQPRLIQRVIRFLLRRCA